MQPFQRQDNLLAEWQVLAELSRPPSRARPRRAV
jgi:hypothetical protein